jgi:hypothetical protein
MQLAWIPLLMTLICLACKRTDFKNRSGLGLHRRKCKLVAPAATAMLEKREAQEMGGNELEAQEDYADEPVHCDCLHRHLFLT